MRRSIAAVAVAAFLVVGCGSKQESFPLSPITYDDSGYLPAKSDASGLVSEPCRSADYLKDGGHWPLQQVGTLRVASPSPVTQDEVDSGVEFVDGMVVQDGSGAVPVYAESPGGYVIYIPFESGCYFVYERMNG